MIALQSLTRILAFMGKELVEVLRRPGAVISLVFGPFVILLVFGTGYEGTRRPLNAEVVIPPSSGLPRDTSAYQRYEGGGLHLAGLTDDEAAATEALANRQLDLVVVAPADLADNFKAGKQSTIRVEYNIVDPIAANYAGFVAQQLSSEVNRQIIQEAASKGQQYAIQEGAGGQVTQFPAEVIAAPTKTETLNLAPTEPAVIPYFGPAALALILQHMAVTLVALSLVREKTTGRLEVFRVAPVSATEVLVGKLLAYGLLNGVVAAAVVALLVGVLHVPILAGPATIAGIIALLTVASLALGLAIAVLSDTERQAVQLSLLVLLASVFFSGFVLAVDEFLPHAQAIAYALPVTHGIRLLQDLMLRGWTNAWWEANLLVILAAALLVVSWAVLRRTMQRG
ncbi:MAG TPA: ABC transporter permease [Candidatus Limnocylindrales bacterium]